jgi:two-component system, NarL family, sensor kinase
MYDTEEQLLAERQTRASHSASLTATILITSLLLALVLFLLHHRLLMDQVAARSRAELAQRVLSAKVLTLQDEERRKFARELHDSVGQHLAATKMAVSTLQAKLPGDTTLQDCIKLLDDSISETRTISHLLHPPLLDEAGLSSAAKWFLEGFAQRSGIEVKVDLPEELGSLPKPVALGLFRVLQESLTNIHRHSDSVKADVALKLLPSRVLLTVRDYGKGIAPDLLENFRMNGTNSGVGLAGMRERIRELGGQFSVQRSFPGTLISVSVPLPDSVETKTPGNGSAVE